ncbi:MAG TPA: hypothetical protein VHI74_02080 [Methyloceanibacter sp.]|jgi:hypothetical protein|nr:hypothetical protein [Methyloceanibacter sp.]
MRQRLTVGVVLLLCGCAAQRASYINQRDAPDLAFKGPLRPVSLSAPQIKQVQQGIAAGLLDERPKTFGKSYRAGINADGQTIVCGYLNGKKFAGMFAKPQGGKTQFLPIGLSVDEQEEDTVKQYCRDDGIYLRQ